MELNQGTLLLVDADCLVRATFTKILEKEGFSVLQSANSKEALLLVKENRPDLAIIDVPLPDASEIDLAIELKNTYNIPFIMLSETCEKDMVSDALKIGALCCHVKPSDISHVIPGIKSALHRARELQQLYASERHLLTAIHANREVSTAIGILMERYRLTNQMAFDKLRTEARSERTKINEIASNLVGAVEMVNKFNVKQ